MTQSYSKAEMDPMWYDSKERIFTKSIIDYLKTLVVIELIQFQKNNGVKVIDYTKSSIENTLEAQNKDSQLGLYQFKTIQIYSNSGRMALLHEQEELRVLDKGYNF